MLLSTRLSSWVEPRPHFPPARFPPPLRRCSTRPSRAGVPRTSTSRSWPLTWRRSPLTTPSGARRAAAFSAPARSTPRSPPGRRTRGGQVGAWHRPAGEHPLPLARSKHQPAPAAVSTPSNLRPRSIPPYFALIIRAIGVLEGIALVGRRPGLGPSTGAGRVGAGWGGHSTSRASHGTARQRTQLTNRPTDRPPEPPPQPPPDRPPTQPPNQPPHLPGRRP